MINPDELERAVERLTNALASTADEFGTVERADGVKLEDLRLILAASPSVGGWEDISTAPKDGTDVLLWSDIFAGEISGPVPCVGPLIGRYSNGVSDYAGEGWWDVEGGDAYASWCLPTHWMPLPPPPSVSIDNGSRPQEAVPTEGLSTAVLVRERDEAVALLRRIVETKNDAYDAEVEALAIRAFLAALSATPQPADGCSSNEGADGWIEWSGGENPVPGQRVDVETRGTGIWRDWLSEQWGTSWLVEEHEDLNCADAIIAYRILPQTEKGS